MIHRQQQQEWQRARDDEERRWRITQAEREHQWHQEQAERDRQWRREDQEAAKRNGWVTAAWSVASALVGWLLAYLSL